MSSDFAREVSLWPRRLPAHNVVQRVTDVAGNGHDSSMPSDPCCSGFPLPRLYISTSSSLREKALLHHERRETKAQETPFRLTHRCHLQSLSVCDSARLLAAYAPYPCLLGTLQSDPAPNTLPQTPSSGKTRGQNDSMTLGVDHSHFQLPDEPGIHVHAVPSVLDRCNRTLIADCFLVNEVPDESNDFCQTMRGQDSLGCSHCGHGGRPTHAAFVVDEDVTACALVLINEPSQLRIDANERLIDSI